MLTAGELMFMHAPCSSTSFLLFFLFASSDYLLSFLTFPSCNMNTIYPETFLFLIIWSNKQPLHEEENKHTNNSILILKKSYPSFIICTRNAVAIAINRKSQTNKQLFKPCQNKRIHKFPILQYSWNTFVFSGVFFF